MAFTGKTGKDRDRIGKISGNYPRQTVPVLSSSLFLCRSLTGIHDLESSETYRIHHGDDGIEVIHHRLIVLPIGSSYLNFSDN